MSTLAAAKADNFYYPPGWDPSKGTLNKYHGSHGALGDRARKLHSEGILVIRFEMPFNVWCQGCNHLIGKGVRFNAEKKQVGMYHSTRIWSFKMRSPCCQTLIEVHTDPKNAEYVVVSGARRKVEQYDAEAAGTLELDPEAREALADPFARLEHADGDKRRAAATYTQVQMLQEDNDAKHRDDYSLNKQLRRQMRGARKEERSLDERRRALGLPDHIQLLPESAADRLQAAAQQYGGNFDAAWKHTRRQLAKGPIFGLILMQQQGRQPGNSNSHSSGSISSSSGNGQPLGPQEVAAAHRLA